MNEKDKVRQDELYQEPLDAEDGGGLDEQEEVAEAPPQVETERAHEDLVVEGDESDTILHTRLPETRFPLSTQDREALDKLCDMFNDMWEDGTCVGLAANQAGVTIRAFTCCMNKEHRVFINPEIVGHHKSKKKKVENCMSVAYIGVNIPRWKTVTIRYQDEDGAEHVEQFRLHKHARIMQHELDHLNGIMITDYYNNLKGERSNIGIHPQEENLM
jgi:peptide deformylase